MKDSGTFSSFVIEMEIVDYRGEILRVSRNDKDPHSVKLFDAAVVSGGNLGVIYSVTLQCIPDYNVIVHTHSFEIGRLDGRLGEMMLSTPSLAIVLSEDTFAIVKTLHPVPALIGDTTLNLFDFVAEFVDQCFAIGMNELNAERFWLKYRLGRLFRFLAQYPTFVKLLSKERMKMMTWDDGETLVKVWKDRAFASFEFHVPVENCDAARAMFLKRVREFRKKGTYNRSSPMFLRGTKPDSRGFLSPSKGNTSLSVSFDIPYQRMDENEIEFYKALEEDLVSLGAKLSWSRDANSAAHVVLRSFPDAHKFVEVMNEVDPHAVFSNAMRREFFGR